MPSFSTAPLADPLSAEEQATFDPTQVSYGLEVLTGAQVGQMLTVGVEGLIIGSGTDATLTLSDSTVSRRHVELKPSPQGVWVKDLGSKNGIFLNGVRVEGFLVRRESTFTAGTTVLRVCATPALQTANIAAFGDAIGGSPVMQTMFASLRRVAQSLSNIVLLGETGTGKEVLARAIHQASARRHRPFVVVDCGGLAPNLVESELFGHLRGSFTGADAERKGAFLSAEGGTVFLDEIGELPLELQPKLLRVLESRTVRRVGEDRDRPIDVRIIAATHRDLPQAVKLGAFREDLYFRLAVLVTRVPPLRERKTDLPLLIQAILARLGRPELELSPALLASFQDHEWPGNVRELRNVIERAVSGGVNVVEAAPKALLGQAPPPDAELPYKAAKEQLVERFTREYFTRLFEKSQSNVTEMAKAAGIARTYAHELVKKYGLK